MTNSFSNKFIFPVNGEASLGQGVRLKALYMLNNPLTNSADEAVVIRQVSQRQAALILVQSSFNVVVTDSTRLFRQLNEYTQVVSKVAVKELAYPRRFELLSAVRDALIRDVELQ